MRTFLATILMIFGWITPLSAMDGTVARGTSILVVIFLGFAALIIVFQFIPGLVLMFSLLKGLFKAAPKKSAVNRDKT